MFIRHRNNLENSLSTTQNSPAKFRLFPERVPQRALLFHNNSPATLHCSPFTTILNENPVHCTRKLYNFLKKICCIELALTQKLENNKFKIERLEEITVKELLLNIL